MVSENRRKGTANIRHTWRYSDIRCVHTKGAERAARKKTDYSVLVLFRLKNPPQTSIWCTYSKVKQDISICIKVQRKIAPITILRHYYLLILNKTGNLSICVFLVQPHQTGIEHTEYVLAGVRNRASKYISQRVAPPLADWQTRIQCLIYSSIGSMYFLSVQSHLSSPAAINAFSHTS